MARSDKDAIRILHGGGAMNRGGIETWLMHVLRHIDREHFRMDFLSHTTRHCDYDDEILAMDCKIIPCMHPSQPWNYARTFRRIMHEHGPYDIIHSHVHHYSGYILRLAYQAGVPVRIAHSHNDTSSRQAQAGLWRRMYLRLMKRWIDRYATVGLAASRQAAAALFGPNWNTDLRWQCLYYGIDLTPFRDIVNPIAVRAELNIPQDAFVIGHVGRFVEQKNHTFLVDVAAEVAKREQRMFLLLVGDGSLRPAIEQKVAQAGLANRVIFTGVRPDVSRLMLGAMDVFLLPSLFEGLGLVLVEAQAAGLPCILSDVVPAEADVVRPLIRRMPLSQPASVWAKAVLAAQKATAITTQTGALGAVEKSVFSIQTCVKQLEDIYCA